MQDCPHILIVILGIVVIIIVILLVRKIITTNDYQFKLQDTPKTIKVIPVENVKSMFDFFQKGTSKPVIIRFIPSKPNMVVHDWYESLDWKNQQFQTEELRKIWKIYCRDRWNLPVNTSVPSNAAEKIMLYNKLKSERKYRDFYSYSLSISHYVTKQWVYNHKGLKFLQDNGINVLQPLYRSLKMWFNSKGYFTPMHRDVVDTISINIVGKKRWVLISPKYSENCYPDFVQSTGAEFYQISNPYSYDSSKFPKFSEVKCLEVDIESGDLLYVPANWIHFVNAMEHSVTLTMVAHR